MTYQRLTATLSLLAVLGLGMAGCDPSDGAAAPGSTDTATSAAPSTPAEPDEARTALRAAAAKLGTDTTGSR